jgi:hypothetical protein
MRLSDAQVKEAILHPSQDVRNVALLYFSDAFSLDPEVMPLAIEAIDKYGWQDAFLYTEYLDDLVHTEETIRWLIRQLKRDSSKLGEGWERHRQALARQLSMADPNLLKTYRSATADIPGLEAEVRENLRERVRLLDAAPEDCWKEIEDFAEREKSTELISEVNLDHAYRQIEALARNGEQYKDRILELLSLEIDNFEDNPMTWTETFMVRLAGEMRLGEAIGPIIRKLHEDADWLDEESVEALTKIGTHDVVDAIVNDFAEGGWTYRLYSTGVLERVRCEDNTQKLIALLEREQDPEIQINLGHALLAQLDSNAIEPVRNLVRSAELNAEMLHLRKNLLTVAELVNSRFEEFNDWQSAAKAGEELASQWQSQDFQVVDGLNTLVQHAANKRLAEAPAITPNMFRNERACRNDLCPCGSGKKFKKCCMRR